jgi:hypothetical protein
VARKSLQDVVLSENFRNLAGTVMESDKYADEKEKYAGAAWDKGSTQHFAEMTQQYLRKHTFERLRAMVPKMIAFFFLSRIESQDVLFARIEREFRQLSREMTRPYAVDERGGGCAGSGRPDAGAFGKGVYHSSGQGDMMARARGDSSAGAGSSADGYGGEDATDDTVDEDGEVTTTRQMWKIHKRTLESCKLLLRQKLNGTGGGGGAQRGSL